MSDPYRAASDRADALMAMGELEIELAASAEKLRRAQYEKDLLVQRWWLLNISGGQPMGHCAPPSTWFQRVSIITVGGVPVTPHDDPPVKIDPEIQAAANLLTQRTADRAAAYRPLNDADRFVRYLEDNYERDSW